MEKKGNVLIYKFETRIMYDIKIKFIFNISELNVSMPHDLMFVGISAT